VAARLADEDDRYLQPRAGDDVLRDCVADTRVGAGEVAHERHPRLERAPHVAGGLECPGADRGVGELAPVDRGERDVVVAVEHAREHPEPREVVRGHAVHGEAPADGDDASVLDVDVDRVGEAAAFVEHAAVAEDEPAHATGSGSGTPTL
jgi:hypothetical protein